MNGFSRLLLILLIGLGIFVVLGGSGAATAQDPPSVTIVLDRSTAQQGDIVTADVVVRDVSNVGGADIGLAVDEDCLRIVDRQPGDLLPAPATGGAFESLSRLDDHSTRLAMSLTDRMQVTTGGGTFFSVQLEVTCAQGTAPLTVTQAQLSAYEDPTAEAVSLVSYSLDAGTLTTSDAELTVEPGAGAQATAAPSAAPTTTPAAAPTAAPTVEPATEAGTQPGTQPAAVDTPPPTDGATPAAPLDEDAGDDAEAGIEDDEEVETVLILIAVLLVMAIVILGVIALWLWQQTRKAAPTDDYR